MSYDHSAVVRNNQIIHAATQAPTTKTITPADQHAQAMALVRSFRRAADTNALDPEVRVAVLGAARFLTDLFGLPGHALN